MKRESRIDRILTLAAAGARILFILQKAIFYGMKNKEGRCTLRKKEPKLELRQQTKMLQTTSLVSLHEQQILESLWNGRNLNVFEYVSERMRNAGISPKRAQRAQEEQGETVDEKVKALLEILSQGTPEEFLLRIRRGESIVSLGAGLGYGAGPEWLNAAMTACLETWVIDISSFSCTNLEVNFKSRSEHIAATTDITRPGYRVVRAEIRNALLEPESVGLELDKVKLWVMNRTLGVLSEATADVALYTMGRSLRREIDEKKENRILVVGPTKEYNPKTESPRMTFWKSSVIRSKIRKGAERPIEIREETFPVLDEIHSALMFYAH